MANSKSYSNFNKPLSHEVINAYKRGLLSPKEMYEVEKRLLEDDLEAEAFEGFALADENKIAKSVEELKHRIRIRTGEAHRPQFIWYSVAAGLVVLITATWIILSTQNPKIDKFANAQEVKNPSKENVSPNKGVSPPVEQSIPSTDNNKASSNSFIASNDLNPLGHLNKQSSPIPSSEAIELSDASVTDDQIILDTLASISPTMAQARAEEREETIELKSSQAPPLSGIIQSKENKVMGQVLANDGRALPGVDVMIKGTTLATITDTYGYYSLPSPPGSILTFKHEGHAEEEVVVKDKSNTVVNITLEKEASMQNTLAWKSSDEKKEIEFKQDQREVAQKPKSEEPIDKSLNSSTPAAAPIIKKEISLTAPAPANGIVDFKKYLKNGIQDFNNAKKNSIKELIVEFLVGKDASISNIKIQPSINKELAGEINRLINEGPKWLPAHKGEEAIDQKVSIQVDFK